MTANRAARKAAEHGRHIFIYNNIRTNQTVYSLQRSMNNHAALSQLPYAGKKTVPPKLRKDVWRPLATVTFPIPAQGLFAYHKLREFRKLHELHWDNNQEYPMLPPETQKKIKEGKYAPTKKERGKIIMDQKANTVADLAAVLKMQAAREELEDDAIQSARERVKLNLEEEILELKELVEKSRGREPAKLREQIAAEMAKLRNEGLSQEEIKEARSRALELRTRKKKLFQARGVLAQKTEEYENLELATRGRDGAVTEVKEQIAEVDKQIAEAQGAVTEMKEQNADSEDKSTSWEDERARLNQRVAALTRERAELVAAEKAKILKKAPLPKYGPLRKKILEAREPKLPFTTDGVRIRWADLFDAEYAESWPEKVQHEPLGLTRHSAPDPDKPPATFKQLQGQRDSEAVDEAAEEATEEAAEEGEEGKEGKEGNEGNEGKVKATA